MKKIITTVCFATSLLTFATATHAQGIYSENMKLASFARSEAAGANFSAGYSELFTGVEAKRTGNGTQLTWKVSEWTGVSHFDIQKSSNNKQYATIGSIGTNERNVYSFTDRDPATGQAYFRIKSVERDGTITYSHVVSTGNEQPSSILIAYPMPARDEITVQHTLVLEKALISVHTLEGNLVMAVPPCAGTMQTTLDFSFLKAGTYMLRFDSGNGKIDTVRIVKQ
jgi:hypothetical protein